MQHSNDSVPKGASDQELVNANAVSTDKLSTSQVDATSAHRDKESDMVDDDAQVDSINESSANNANRKTIMMVPKALLDKTKKLMRKYQLVICNRTMIAQVQEIKTV